MTTDVMTTFAVAIMATDPMTAPTASAMIAARIDLRKRRHQHEEKGRAKNSEAFHLTTYARKAVCGQYGSNRATPRRPLRSRRAPSRRSTTTGSARLFLGREVCQPGQGRQERPGRHRPTWLDGSAAGSSSPCPDPGTKNDLVMVCTMRIVLEI